MKYFLFYYETGKIVKTPITIHVTIAIFSYFWRVIMIML
jgi:hypothetical protein